VGKIGIRRVVKLRASSPGWMGCLTLMVYDEEEEMDDKESNEEALTRLCRCPITWWRLSASAGMGGGGRSIGQIHVCRCFSSQGSEKCKYCMPV